MTGKNFFGQWVATVTITMLLAVMGAFTAIWSVGEAVQRALGDVAAWLVVGAIFGGLIGLGAGLGQAVTLRGLGVPFDRWLGRSVSACAAGAMVAFVLLSATNTMENMPELAIAVVMALMLGLPIGLAQAHLLRSHVAQPQLWTPICVVAFLVAFGVGLPLGGEGRAWLSVGVVALLLALLTGAGMLWLLQGSQKTAAAQ